MSRKIESVKELREVCQPPKKTKGLTTKCLRGVSIYFTKLFLILGISANQVTTIGLPVYLLAFVLFCFGPPIWIIGTLLMIFWLILDFSDGEVARYNGTSSLKGRWLDDRIGEAAPVLKWFGITIGLYTIFPGLPIIIFGSLAIVFPRLRHMIKYHYRLLIETNRSNKKISKNVVINDASNKKNKKFEFIDLVVNKIGLRTEYILLVTMSLDFVIPSMSLNMCPSMLRNLIVPSSISLTYAFMIVFGVAETMSYAILVYLNFKKLR